VVRLKWNANKEPDLYGYRVYRGNTPKEEFSLLTGSPIKENSFQDSTSIKSLNSRVYYKIVATDQRYNMSEESEVLILKKPDVVPPTAPVFKQFSIEKGYINLNWANSSSEDLKSQIVYRKEEAEPKWIKVYEDRDKMGKYEDRAIEEGKTYQYYLLAIDDSGLYSSSSPVVSLFVPKSSLKSGVKGFFGKADYKGNQIQLNWEYNEKEVLHFELYKAPGAMPLQLMQEVPAANREFKDMTVAVNTVYKYGIRAVFKDGRYSKMEFFTINF
jgi:hypothetical protein